MNKIVKICTLLLRKKLLMACDIYPSSFLSVYATPKYIILCVTCTHFLTNQYTLGIFLYNTH